MPDEGPPLDTATPQAEPALELADLTVRVARTMRRAGSAHLAPLGVTFGQGRLLRLLAGGPLRMAEIAARMDVVPRSATDMVDTLQRSGLADRAADPADRRSVLVTLTDDGHELLRRMVAGRRAAALSVFGRLDRAQQHDLLDLLRTVLADNPHCHHDTHHDTHHGGPRDTQHGGADARQPEENHR